MECRVRDLVALLERSAIVDMGHAVGRMSRQLPARSQHDGKRACAHQGLRGSSDRFWSPPLSNYGWTSRRDQLAILEYGGKRSILYRSSDHTSQRFL